MTTSTFKTPSPDRYLTVIDLCCGCGMASYGLTLAGLDIAGAWDVWENALETYALNVSQNDALENWTIEHPLPWGSECRGRADVVVMGPPCQDDSRANHRSDDKGRGELKHPAFERAREAGARWIVMEMVSKRFVPWALDNGARQVLKLNDWKLGGFTGRTRWFAVWGPSDLEIPELPEAERKGWGDAFPHLDTDGAVLTTEAHSKAKRWQHARTPDQPAHAVVGQGCCHVLRYADGEEVRLGPQEAAALSGLPARWQFADPQWISDGTEGRMVPFGARNWREAQTMVGNGWPVAFGKAIGEAILRAEAELPADPEPTSDPSPEAPCDGLSRPEGDDSAPAGTTAPPAGPAPSAAADASTHVDGFDDLVHNGKQVKTTTLKGGSKRGSKMARKGHRARRLIEREVELQEGDPIGSFVNWRLPKSTVTWAAVKKALEAADLSLDLYAPPRKRKPYTRNEIMRLLTRNLYDYLGAVSLVEKGGAYFVPAPYLPEVRQHQTFIEALYSKEADQRCGVFMTAVHLPGDLPKLVGIELWDTVDLLTTEADGFSEAAPRSDTLKRRTLELAAMKRKCELFDQVFGCEFTAELKKTITDLELTIEAMSDKLAA